MVVTFLQLPSRASHSPNGCDVWLEVAPVRMTVGTRFHWVISSAPATGTNTGTPVSRLTWATAGPSWPHSGPTRKCTFSLCTRRRAWLSALSGLQAVSATMMRTGRPATLLPCCSQNSSCPRTVSWPDLASAPVSGARNPMRISSCALARDTTVLTRTKTTAAVSRLMASSSGARSKVAHIYHDRARRERPGGIRCRGSLRTAGASATTRGGGRDHDEDGAAGGGHAHGFLRRQAGAAGAGAHGASARKHAAGLPEGAREGRPGRLRQRQFPEDRDPHRPPLQAVQSPRHHRHGRGSDREGARVRRGPGLHRDQEDV